MSKIFEDFIGEKLERVHGLPIGLADYKSITFNFGNGRCLTFEVELHLSTDGLFPAMRVSKGKWELIHAAPSAPKVRKKEVGTPDLKMIDGANQDEESSNGMMVLP